MSDFFDFWESLDPQHKIDQSRSELIKYLDFARKNVPFYKTRLSDVDDKGENPLSSVPILNPSDLRENLPPTNSQLLSRDTTAYTVFQSGGTTGIPKTSLFTHEELEGLNLPNGRGFHAVGLNANDRVANFFAVGSLYMTFVHINRMLQQFGCTNFPFANNTPVDFAGNVANLFKVNCFTGITSVVLSNLRELYQMGFKDLHVEKVFYGGEHIYDADRQELKQKFGTEVIAAPGYGTVDTWYLGYQCDKAGHGVFHAHDDQVYIEMLEEEPENLAYPKTVVHGEIGLLYATAFSRKLTPIIRYKVGDRARWIKEPCACGRTTPLFQLLGRGDDVLRIGYDSIEYNAVQKIAAQIAGLSGTIQMQKQREDGKDKLVIRIEAFAEESQFLNLAEVFKEKLLLDRSTLRDFVKKGTILEPVVEVVKQNSLPINKRTGKLIRVIDAIT